MQTLLEITQALARRLRATPPTTVENITDPYFLMLVQIINDVKREIESAHAWRVNDRTFSITTTPTGTSYSLLGMQSVSRWTINMVIDRTAKSELRNDNYIHFQRRKIPNPTRPGAPEYYIVVPPVLGIGTQVPRVELFPVPTDARQIDFLVNSHQAILSLDGHEPNVDPQLVFLGAYARAYVERGEAVSASPLSGSPLQDYQNALSDAIAHDVETQNNGRSQDWFVNRA